MPDDNGGIDDAMTTISVLPFGVPTTRIGTTSLPTLLLSEAETGVELPLSHSPGLGGGEKRVSEGQADAGTSSDGSGAEPCTELDSVIVIGRARERTPSRVSRDGQGMNLA